MKTSIKPDNYFSTVRQLRTLKTEEEARKSGKSPDDQAIHDMGATKGWELLNGYIDSLKRDLDDLIKGLMEQGASYEVIGQKTIVKELCKEMLERIQQKVQDATESIET